jgi:hypothetical protein
MASLVIHTPSGVSAAERERANELGPSHTADPLDPIGLAREAGFAEAELLDLTQDFEESCLQLQEYRRENAEALKVELGAEEYEIQGGRTENMLHGIGEGLLRRSLFKAVAPGG